MVHFRGLFLQTILYCSLVQYIIIIAGMGGAVGAQRLVLRVMSLKGRVRARARTRGRNPFVILQSTRVTVHSSDWVTPPLPPLGPREEAHSLAG